MKALPFFLDVKNNNTKLNNSKWLILFFINVIVMESTKRGVNEMIYLLKFILYAVVAMVSLSTILGALTIYIIKQWEKR